MDERRSFTRYNAAYWVETQEKKRRKVICLEDISKGGAAFRAEEGLKKDQGINLRVFLRNRMFDIRAVVVYVKALEENSFSIGTRFIEPPLEFGDLLDKEIEEIIESQQARRHDISPDRFRKASIKYQKRKIF